MIDITHKIKSLRKAVAIAEIKVSIPETIQAVQEKKVPKGDVFEFSRAAGLLAIKKTSDVIPDCHPMPVEFADIKHKVEGLSIFITVEVHAIYRTGVEVEAMHGAAITALTMYDMLKPLDKGIEISSIRLLEKKGGKSGMKDYGSGELKCAVLVCSDGVSAGEREDISGKTIAEKLNQYSILVALQEVIPDDETLIQSKARQLSEEGFDLVLFTGGTGLSPRDVTPDAISPLLDKEVPGLMEAARNYGQERTPYAMLSRGVAGFIGDMLVITLPGSPRGAAETMDALFPYVLHLFSIRQEKQHDITGTGKETA